MSVLMCGLPATSPVSDTDRHATAKAPLGAKFHDGLGNEYTYVCAGADIAQYEAVMFQGSALGFDDVRKTSAADKVVLGIATAAFDQSEAPYGLVLTRGVTTAKVVDSTTAGLPLGSCATAGVLDDLAETNLAGVRAIVALATGAATGSKIAIL